MDGRDQPCRALTDAPEGRNLAHWAKQGDKRVRNENQRGPMIPTAKPTLIAAKREDVEMWSRAWKANRYDWGLLQGMIRMVETDRLVTELRFESCRPLQHQCNTAAMRANLSHRKRGGSNENRIASDRFCRSHSFPFAR